MDGAGRRVSPRVSPMAGSSIGTAGSPRRTQAERSEESRRRIVEAAVELVAERGIGAATMAAVAEQAGRSVGAIQHQFTDKDGLQVAVLEHGLDRLGEILDGVPADADSIRARAENVVDALWAGYREPDFLAVMEVLRSIREADAGRVQVYLDQVLHAAGGAWLRLFGDGDLDEAAMWASIRLVFGTLNGLALEQFLAGRSLDEALIERAALVGAVTELLDGS